MRFARTYQDCLSPARRNYTWSRRLAQLIGILYPLHLATTACEYHFANIAGTISSRLRFRKLGRGIGTFRYLQQKSAPLRSARSVIASSSHLHITLTCLPYFFFQLVQYSSTITTNGCNHRQSDPACESIGGSSRITVCLWPLNSLSGYICSCLWYNLDTSSAQQQSGVAHHTFSQKTPSALCNSLDNRRLLLYHDILETSSRHCTYLKLSCNYLRNNINGSFYNQQPHILSQVLRVTEYPQGNE